MQMLLWVQKAYPGAVKRATAADGAVFPEGSDELKLVPFEDLFGLLDSIGWTVDFLASYMFITCACSVFSRTRRTRACTLTPTSRTWSREYNSSTVAHVS